MADGSPQNPTATEPEYTSQSSFKIRSSYRANFGLPLNRLRSYPRGRVVGELQKSPPMDRDRQNGFPWRPGSTSPGLI